MGWSSIQTRLGWKWADCGIHWLIWKMIVALKNTFLSGINLFVNVTEAKKLNSYFQIMDLRILL